MCKIIINGGRPLSGSVRVQGAKNSVLPILAATVLCADTCVIHDCPDLRDVNASIKILECLGCKVKKEKNTVTVDAVNITNSIIPDDLMHQMRSSITFLGAITARCKTAGISMPGGCELGPRPVDLHIKALRDLGVTIEDQGGHISAKADVIRGCEIHLDFPSVGATENVMLAAATAKDTTIITNAAKEPEIHDLQNFLCKMGADITGAGSDVIVIKGVKKLHGAEHRVIPDRIVASTYLCAAAMTGGSIELENVETAHIKAVTSILKDAGAAVYVKKNSMVLIAPKRIMPVDILRTMPYPGFPTDAQAVVTAMLTVADGTSIIVENIFENRFKHCDELCRMGANIKVDGRVAVIRGVPRLNGAAVTAMELRGGAALVIAGVAADGTTEVGGIEHVDRGYENMTADIAALGADIKRVPG
jgi:UDP-N-acetylglucosamine 1-carboxyvinyltransferase